MNSNSGFLPKEINEVTEEILEYITFNENDSMTILNALEVKKNKVHDTIIIWILRICRASVCCHLEITLKNCLNRESSSRFGKRQTLP